MYLPRKAWITTFLTLLCLIVWKAVALASTNGNSCPKGVACAVPSGCTEVDGPDTQACSTLFLDSDPDTSKCCVYLCYRETYTGSPACLNAPSCVNCIYEYSVPDSQCLQQGGGVDNCIATN